MAGRDSHRSESVLPHDPERSSAQIRGLLQLAAPGKKRILELGCGEGRVLLPLAQAGHELTGIDHEDAAIDVCRTLLSQRGLVAELVCENFVDWLQVSSPGRFDLILCVGNTFMTIAELDSAIGLLRAARDRLSPDGIFVIDDLPHDLWPELTSGNWQTGLSEDGRSQLIWHPHDSVFTIRRGRDINPASWTLEPGDSLYRLWTSSALSLAAQVAGLSEPRHLAEGAVLVMQAKSDMSGQCCQGPQ